MSITNTKIGSGLPPRAGSAPIVRAATQAALLIAEAAEWKDRDPRLQEAIEILTVAIASEAEPTCNCGCQGDPFVCIENDGTDRTPATSVAAEGDAGMGVTGNAVLLLGNVLSHIIGAPDRLYEVEQIDAGAGTVLIRRRGTENIHRISIVQLEGIE